MKYYADYEALEFDNKRALQEGIYPYYLNSELTKTSLCPIYVAVSNEFGELVQYQNCYKEKISFMKILDWVVKREKEKSEVTIISFHNVQYDCRIILHELFYNGFVNIFDNDSITYYGDCHKPQTDKTFVLIGKNFSRYIGLNINYKGHKILIRDTFSILSTSQNKILKSFGYPEKVDIDWKEITIDNLRRKMSRIIERCNYDCQSLARSIEKFKQVIKEEFRGEGLTAAGMSLSAYKQYLYGIAYPRRKEPTPKELNECFKGLYPQITDEDATIISRYCYTGGLVTVNPFLSSKLLKNLVCIDINSSYPKSMTYELPYGEPMEINGFSKKGYSEYIVYIEFQFKNTDIPFMRCHSENYARAVLHIPLLPKEKLYTKSQFPYKFSGYLCINSIELETLCKYAKVKTLEFKKGYKYLTNKIMKDFIEPIYEKREKIKKENKEKVKQGLKPDEVLDTAYKLLLNSLYGKFAQDLGGIVFLYDNMTDYNRIIAVDNNVIYRPVSSAITAYSRRAWVDMVYMLGSDFIYGDTDSVYFKNPEKHLKRLKELGFINSSELGKWSEEYDGGIKKGKFLSKKNYLIEVYDKKKKKYVLKLTCVGFSKQYHHQIDFSNFTLNSKEFEVEKMVNIYGGKAMKQTKFRIMERAIDEPLLLEKRGG